MELIVRAVFLYIFIMIVFRMSGKRALSKLTTFDFIVLLIAGEATQNALLSNDNSLINAMLLVATLITLDVFFSFISQKFNIFDKITNGVPVIILKDGELMEDRMRKQRIEIDDILESARRSQGLDSLDQIKYAVLERDGEISIIPK